MSDPDPAYLNRLRREAQNPFRGLRQVFYLVFAASGLMGGFILFLKAIAGQGGENIGWSLALQIGVVVVMISLWRWEQQRSAK